MIDDKNLVIICATVIILAALFASSVTDPTSVVTSGLTGLFGVAVGKAMK